VGEARKALVWIYVDETGAVRRAQVHQPAGGVDRDIAARDRARLFHFQPATLAGRAVGAWVLMPVSAVPPPPSCADFASVPLSAGARYVDSTASGRPEGGARYRYAAQGFGIDLFVYRHPEGVTPRGEVERTLALLRHGSAAGAGDSAAVVRAGPERIQSLQQGFIPRRADSLVVIRGDFTRVRPSRRFRGVEFEGYSAVFRGVPTRTPMESYVAVFSAGDEDLEVRATYPRTRGARGQVAEFVQQVLSDRAWRMRGCPRQ
jgi:hypothetical protein